MTGEFSTAAASGGADGCSQTTVQPGASCVVTVMFTPLAAGQRTGSIVFPVVYRDKTTTSLTLSLTGKGITAIKTIQISAGSSLYFGELTQGSVTSPHSPCRHQYGQYTGHHCRRLYRGQHRLHYLVRWLRRRYAGSRGNVLCGTCV